ncbi:histidine-rich glycoprotein [Grus japonensis]|uniref:Histidine-rich glycoprotein n=1 Tax=Grus japonensis TaxID=30415 RepID=A0ABC9X7T1_GRUJA
MNFSLSSRRQASNTQKPSIQSLEMRIPPDLLECKDCPVKDEVLEVTEQHKDNAAKTLKKFNSEGNYTKYFNVEKVEKILKMHVGFCKTRIISDPDEADGTETNCEIYHPWGCTHLLKCLWLYPHAGYRTSLSPD